MLPGILRSILPDILHECLAPGRLPSASPPPTTTRPPQSSPSLGVLVADRLTELAKEHITSLFDNANDQAYSLRNQADGEFEEVVADHRINVDTIKEDCIRELGEVVDDKLCRFKEQTDEIVETAVEEVENKSGEIRDDICDGLEDFLQVASASLKKLRQSKSSDEQSALTT
jgi:F0F1-type ATP synthase membrane subunit b/b'